MRLIHISEDKHTIKNSLAKAKAILRYKPDVLFLEYPQDSFPKNTLNKFQPKRKSREILRKWEKLLLKNSGRYPWLKGDVQVIRNIAKLRKKVLVYLIDAPLEVTKLCDKIVKSQNRFLFDVWNFIREIYMANLVRHISLKYKNKRALIFCHNSHWRHIKFLLRAKNGKIIIRHYFGPKSANDIAGKLDRQANKTRKLLKKYFCKVTPNLL